MFGTAPAGSEWSWLRSLQGSYHKWSQSSIKTWATKATKGDENPPKAKHVRRIIVSSLRDADVTPRFIAQYLLNERPWANDPRVAAKSLYIILILLQYQNRLTNSTDITKMTNKVVSFYSDHPPTDEKMRLYCEVAQRLGAIIHSKLIFHESHGEVHGNFHVPTHIGLQQLIPDLRKHLTTVLYETNGIQAAVQSSKDFVATVLWQPMVDETVSAYRLLKSIDNDSEMRQLLTDAEKLIHVLPSFPYIATTVIFPTRGEKITIPRERWPKRVE